MTLQERRNEPVDVTATHQRAIRLGTGVGRPFAAIGQRMAWVFGVAAIGTVVVGAGAGSLFLAGCTAVALWTIGAVVAWLPFSDPAFRAAAELYFDHNCHEAAEWKRETGTSMPRGRRAAERWLDAHPKASGRASLLLFLGRISEADRAMAARRPTTAVEAFELELLHQTRALLVEDAPRTERLHAMWTSIPDRRERRHRRQCLALLEAQLAVAQGRPPIPVLADARADAPDVYWSMRAPMLMAKWWLLGVLPLVAAIVVVAAASGAPA